MGYQKRIGSSAANGNDAYLLKISPEGDSLWSAYFGNTKRESVYSFCRSNDGAYALVGSNHGQTVDQGQSHDVLFIKTFIPTDPALKSKMKPGLFPNPNNGNFQIICSTPFKSIEVFDSSGKVVFIQKQASSNIQPSIPVQLPFLRPGVYYARIQTVTNVENQSFVIQ